MKNASFQGASGAFDRETYYRFVLDQQGWTETEFEAATRSDVSRAPFCRRRLGRLHRASADGGHPLSLDRRAPLALDPAADRGDLTPPCPNPVTRS